ncbi:MAG: NUDIX hydrolase [Patescibacteria group bacterium]|jgi:ADP-ribose pyrophosphatase YjhB (NUDIX family)
MVSFKKTVQNNFKFCSCCGTKFIYKKIHGSSELYCPKCGFIFWQNSKPTASGLLIKDRQVLLTKRGITPLKGYWDAPGGFLNFHEKPEIGMARELKEELGIKIFQPKLLGIHLGEYLSQQPQSTFNLYYIIKKWTGTLKPADDVVGYKWFKINQLPKKLAFANNKQALKDLQKLLG